jgi:hypothetical protein
MSLSFNLVLKSLPGLLESDANALSREGSQRLRQMIIHFRYAGE